MSNKKMLECLEQNVDGLEKIQNLMMFEDPLVYDDLIQEIRIDHFYGYEALLPVMLISTDDPVIARTGKRLLLQLYCEKLQEVGGRQIVDRVTEILTDEKERWDKRIKRLLKLKKQNKL